MHDLPFSMACLAVLTELRASGLHLSSSNAAFNHIKSKGDEQVEKEIESAFVVQWAHRALFGYAHSNLWAGPGIDIPDMAWYNYSPPSSMVSFIIILVIIIMYYYYCYYYYTR